MIHGHTEHGFQYLDPEKRRWPTTYYGATTRHRAWRSTIIRAAPRRTQPSERCGSAWWAWAAARWPPMAKKGTTSASTKSIPRCCGSPTSTSPIARTRRREVDVVLGDARINMEQELAAGNPQQFDVLAVDAFSSDSIPMHLLTRECVELYRKHLKPDGLLCMHISNRFLDLSGVVRWHRQGRGMRVRVHRVRQRFRSGGRTSRRGESSPRTRIF